MQQKNNQAPQNNWASVLKKGIRDTDQNAPETRLTSPSSQQQQQQNDPKSARRQHILQQALKSRCNAITNERYCLSCGRPFKDLFKLAQHIADKHDGTNDASASLDQHHTPTMTQTAINYKKPTLGDAFPSTTSTTALNESLNHKQQHQLAQEKKRNSISKQQHPTPDQRLKAPEGLKSKRKKRPSRLKKGYQKTRAQQAIYHWQEVLATIEEALQITNEQMHSFDHDGGVNEIKEKMNDDNDQERITQLLNAHAIARDFLSQSQHQFDPGSFPLQKKNVDKDSKQEIKNIVDTHEMTPPPRVSSSTSLPAPLSPATAVPYHSINKETEIEASKSRNDNGVPDLPCTRMNKITTTTTCSSSSSSSSSSDECIRNSTTSSKSQCSTSSSSSDCTTSSDGSFELQWGNVLLTWAQTVGADAKREQMEQKSNVKKQETFAGIEMSLNSNTSNTNMKKNMERENMLDRGIKNMERENMLDRGIKTASNDKNKSYESHIIKNDYESDPILDPGMKKNIPGVDSLEKKDEILDPSVLVIDWLDHNAVHAEPFDHYSNQSSVHDNDYYGSNLQAAHTSITTAPITTTTTAPLTTAPLTTTPTTTPPPTAPIKYHCEVCNITTNGSTTWNDHIHSLKHRKKTSAVQKDNPPQYASTVLSPYSIPSSAITSALITIKDNQRRYIGPNADVAPYVDHIITPELNAAVSIFLTQLLQWQERVRQTDPVNYRRKRRVVSGMREVLKFVKIEKKVKVLIVAPNVDSILVDSSQSIEDDGSCDHPSDTSIVIQSTTTNKSNNNQYSSGEYNNPIQPLLDAASRYSIPVIFALTRHKLGKFLGRNKSASAFAVLDASGAEGLLQDVMKCRNQGKL